MKRLLFDRGLRAARSLFTLEKHVEGGFTTVISPRLKEHILWIIAYAWTLGYRAGRNAAAKRSAA